MRLVLCSASVGRAEHPLCPSWLFPTPAVPVLAVPVLAVSIPAVPAPRPVPQLCRLDHKMAFPPCRVPMVLGVVAAARAALRLALPALALPAVPAALPAVPRSPSSRLSCGCAGAGWGTELCRGAPGRMGLQPPRRHPEPCLCSSRALGSAARGGCDVGTAAGQQCSSSHRCSGSSRLWRPSLCPVAQHRALG